MAHTGATQAVPSGLSPIKDQLLTLLTNGILAANGTHGGNTTAADINPPAGDVLDYFFSNQPYNSSQPKAFLNWMIVDEEFNKVTSSFHMGSVQVPAISGAMQKQQLTGPANMTVRRGGWLYVYVSNESNQDVYFDDLVINHKRGPVVETNSYYAFGMEIPGLNAKAIGFGTSPQNRVKYNGKELQNKEFSDGSGLEWEDYGARMYDPQIGRWMVVDPMADKTHGWSPYNYAFDNPIIYIDPDGMAGEDVNPPYTIGDLISYAAKNSKYFSSLLSQNGITIDNYSDFISFAPQGSEHPTNTDVISGQIQIDPKASFNDNILGLAHELTNRSNRTEFQDQVLNVALKKITPDQYAINTITIETKSVFSQYKVAKELKFKNLGKGSDPGSNKNLAAFRKGILSEAGLKKILFSDAKGAYDPKTGQNVYDLYKANGQGLQNLFDRSRQDNDTMRPVDDNKNVPNCLCATPPWVKPFSNSKLD